MSFRFFFSYARDNRDSYLNKFYADLTEQIQLRQFHKPGEIGFFDGEGIQAGAPWKNELSAALRVSRTFLALCSPAYLNSEYCGKEFHVFLRRYREYVTGTRPAGTPRLIQPVIWGEPRGSLREVLTEFQYTDDQYPQIYKNEGLRYMMSKSDLANDYTDFVHRLAIKLVDDSEQHPLPELATLEPLETIPSAFHDNPGAPQAPEGTSVWFAYVAAKPQEFPQERRTVDRYRQRGGKEWRPFHPDLRDPVGIFAQATASKYSLFAEELPLDDSLVDRIRTLAAKGEPAIVLVDAWTLRVARYRALMKKLDEVNLPNCAVMIAWNHPDSETEQHRAALQAEVDATFQFKRQLRKVMPYEDSIQTAAELRKRLLGALAKFTNKKSERLPARGIISAEIRQAAEREGITLDRTPLVPSPASIEAGGAR